MTKCYLSALFAFGLLPAAWPTVAAADAVTEAYELRMSGKVDQARTLLEEALANNPDNAAAYYELARTQMHMALGHPRTIEQGFADARKSIDRAVALDSPQVIYHTFAGHVAYFQAYYALQLGKPDTKDHFTAASNAFEAALKLKPDYPQVMLYLVELHSHFPKSAGVDKSKAAIYAGKLATTNDTYAAKAKSILSPESCGVEFWKQLAKNEPRNADVLEELGKAYLKEDQVEQAVKSFEQAIEVDPDKTYLYLDLSIYHTFRAMRARKNDQELFQQSLQDGNTAITKYLNSRPIHPLQAYALGVQSKYKSAAGDKEQAKQLVQRAEKLDPYFSKATGAPDPDQFIPPTEISQNHRYLMRPF